MIAIAAVAAFMPPAPVSAHGGTAIVDGTFDAGVGYQRVATDGSWTSSGNGELKVWMTCDAANAYFYFNATLPSTEDFSPSVWFFDTNASTNYNGRLEDRLFYVDMDLGVVHADDPGPTPPVVIVGLAAQHGNRSVEFNVPRTHIAITNASHPDFGEDARFNYDVWTTQPQRNTGWANQNYALMALFKAPHCDP